MLRMRKRVGDRPVRRGRIGAQVAVHTVRRRVDVRVRQIEARGIVITQIHRRVRVECAIGSRGAAVHARLRGAHTAGVRARTAGPQIIAVLEERVGAETTVGPLVVPVFDVAGTQRHGADDVIAVSPQDRICNGHDRRPGLIHAIIRLIGHRAVLQHGRAAAGIDAVPLIDRRVARAGRITGIGRVAVQQAVAQVEDAAGDIDGTALRGLGVGRLHLGRVPVQYGMHQRQAAGQQVDCSSAGVIVIGQRGRVLLQHAVAEYCRGVVDIHAATACLVTPVVNAEEVADQLAGVQRHARRVREVHAGAAVILVTGGAGSAADGHAPHQPVGDITDVQDALGQVIAGVGRRVLQRSVRAVHAARGLPDRAGVPAIDRQGLALPDEFAIGVVDGQREGLALEVDRVAVRRRVDRRLHVGVGRTP